MKFSRALIPLAFLFLTASALYFSLKSRPSKLPPPPNDPNVGLPIDSLNNVIVYSNGAIANVTGRNTTPDGYNLGLKYQCVEFVKRYYYQHLHHKMPDSYGHAKEFFDPSLPDGQSNPKRDLTQFTNPSQAKPQPDDLLVYDATPHNPYGHVSIIARVTDHEIEIIQQNSGPQNQTRATYPLVQENNTWRIQNQRILGWLRKSPQPPAP